MDSKQLMDELLKARELIETSLRQSLRELEEMEVSPNDSLLDAEGYPRTDIDLYRVRSLRSSIARQQTDHKEIMKKIEKLLPTLLPSQSNNFSTQFQRSCNLYQEPFAKIGIVPITSYAYQKGVCSNDLIVAFGNLSKESFKDLSQLANEVNSHKQSGNTLEISLRRSLDNGLYNLKIDFAETDAFGCQILPLNSS